jgi:hypothetical protein
MRDFIQANVETNVKQNEELSKRAIPGVTKYLAALRHAQRFRRPREFGYIRILDQEY